MDVKIDLTHDYDVQYYLDDDGNICISGNVYCDCYEEELLQIKLSPESIVKLLREEWIERIVREVIRKEIEEDERIKAAGGRKGKEFILPEGMVKDLVLETLNTPTMLERIKDSETIKIKKKDDEEG